MTGNAGSDFRIKLLVVHPDGRRQKFLVTFPERRTLKIDQRYIGLPLTLRVDFVPGAIICRPGTGHTLTIAGKPVKEHSLNVNDSVGLDQYSIEFLELPEPLPLDEATRFVNINEMVEATVIAAMPREPRDTTEFTPPLSSTQATNSQHRNQQLPYAPQAPSVPQVTQNRTPTPAPRVPENPVPQQHAPQYSAPRQPAPQQDFNAPYRPDPEDSTAIIRRLQVPGGPPPGQNSYSNYSTLEPASRSDSTNTGTASRVTSTGFVVDQTEGGDGGKRLFRMQKPGLILGAATLALILAYMALSPKATEQEPASTEFASEQPESESLTDGKSSDALEPVQAPAVNEEARKPEPSSVVTESDPAVIPSGAIPAPIAMATGEAAPTGNPFEDATGGFDPMATTQFFSAVEAGDEDKIKELIEKRIVDVNLTKQKGYAVLHLAAANGDLQTVKFLIRMKADVNVLDGSGATPLMWAVFRRREAVVKFLAPKTNLKIQRDGGETAHALAKRMKQTKLLSVLDPEPNKKKSARKSDSKKRVPTSLPNKKK